jgi:hypothetical protein
MTLKNNKYRITLKKTRKHKRTKKIKRKQHKHNLFIGGDLTKYIDYDFFNKYNDNLSKIQKVIEIYSGKHFIDETLASKFINNQISIVRRQAAKDLIDNTVYITLHDINSIIESLILQLYSIIDLSKDIYFYSGKPDKSFYFMTILALFHIRNNKLKEPTGFLKFLDDKLFDEIKEDSQIIILDDISYSGAQLSNLLTKIYNGRVLKLKKNPPNIYILLAALNNFSKFKLTHILNKKYEYEMSPFKLLHLPERLYTPLIIKLGIQRYFNLIIFFSPYTENTPYVSMYLDYKIADEASTFKNALTYGPIIPSNYDYNSFIQYVINENTKYKVLPKRDFLKQEQINEYNNCDLNCLIKNLLKNDHIEKEQTTNAFEPFINGCNKNTDLINNINDYDIKNLDYRFFLAPKDCIGTIEDGELIKNEECIIEDYNAGFLTNLSEKISDKNIIIKINDKINGINCPVPWYKNGEYKMI